MKLYSKNCLNVIDFQIVDPSKKPRQGNNSIGAFYFASQKIFKWFRAIAESFAKLLINSKLSATKWCKQCRLIWMYIDHRCLWLYLWDCYSFGHSQLSMHFDASSADTIWWLYSIIMFAFLDVFKIVCCSKRINPFPHTANLQQVTLEISWQQ